MDPFNHLNGLVPFGSGDDVYQIDGDPDYVSDTKDLPTAIRALRVSKAGDVMVTTRVGQQRIMAFLEGETRYVRITRVWKTGTTACGLEGLV